MTYVKKTDPSIKNRLVNNRQFSLNGKVTKSSPCHQRNYKTCPMIVNKEELLIDGKKVKSAPGTCHSYNVIWNNGIMELSAAYAIYVTWVELQDRSMKESQSIESNTMNF